MTSFMAVLRQLLTACVKAIIPDCACQMHQRISQLFGSLWGLTCGSWWDYSGGCQNCWFQQSNLPSLETAKVNPPWSGSLGVSSSRPEKWGLPKCCQHLSFNKLCLLCRLLVLSPNPLLSEQITMQSIFSCLIASEEECCFGKWSNINKGHMPNSMLASGQ